MTTAGPVPPGRRLVTIPISHYCEKARWALDRAGLAYREERHVQVVHRVAARRAGGGPTVPVLVAPEGLYPESAEILAYADRHADPARRLAPPATDSSAEMSAFERRLDDDLGPHARRWTYSRFLPLPDLAAAYNCAGVPAWERRAFPLAYPLVSAYIRRHLRVDAATTAESARAVGTAFDAIAERLSDGRRFLFGDAFTSADLTFASLAAAVLLPPEYGVPLPQPAELPPETAREVQTFRAHAAGAYALRLFREERRGSP